MRPGAPSNEPAGRLIPISMPDSAGAVAPREMVSKAIAAWDRYFDQNPVTSVQLREIVARLERARNFGHVRAAIASYLKHQPKGTQPESWMNDALKAATAAYWDDYYKHHDETPSELLETLTLLGQAKKFDQVEAAVWAYLQHYPKRAEPWMYEWLAVSLDQNQRDANQVKTALGYAGYLALQSGKWAHMIRVADFLFLRGYLDPFEVQVGTKSARVGVGLLLDRAAEKAPHLPEPLMMSANLALKAKDPKRLADTLERLLALGWPDIDETIRAQAHEAAATLAKTLREEGRVPEAEALLARVTAAEGRDLFIRLTWTGDADLDLLVQEPLGATASHALRRTVFGGALIKEGHGGRHAEEVYSCPRGFNGDYTIWVKRIANDPDHPVTEANLEIFTHEGLPSEHKETRTVSLADAKPIVVHLSDGRRKTVLPFVAPVTLASSPSPPKPAAKPRRAATATQPAKPPAIALPGADDRPKPPPILVPAEPSPKPTRGRSAPAIQP
jgi:hypothetical protein